MVTIYTSNSSASCKKAINWLNEYNIPYKEINIFTQPITKKDIKKMLENTPNGFEDIVSTRSKAIINNHIIIDDMSFNEACDFLINNPSALKRPILVDDNKLQVGYNNEEIRTFIPKEQRMKTVFSPMDDAEYNLAYSNGIEELF